LQWKIYRPLLSADIGQGKALISDATGRQRETGSAMQQFIILIPESRNSHLVLTIEPKPGWEGA